MMCEDTSFTRTMLRIQHRAQAPHAWKQPTYEALQATVESVSDSEREVRHSGHICIVLHRGQGKEEGEF